MKKSFIGLIFFSVLVSACSQKNESVDVVKTFWKGFSENDQLALASVLQNAEDAEFLASGKSTLSDYKVLGEVADGVEVKFSRFCYPDVIVSTRLVEVNGEKKIDFRSTLKAQMKAMKGVKTTKKYCYDFEDKPLSGVLSGQAWQFNKVHVRDINWGNKITQNITLYAEDCDVEMSGKCTEAKLIISNLDLQGEGGNFTNKKNVTIHIPPSDNIVVSTGSYKVSTLASGAKEIALSFKQDELNTLNGYFVLEKKTKN